MTLLIRLEVAITGGIKAAPAPDGVAGQGGACASARRGGNRPGLEFRFLDPGRHGNGPMGQAVDPNGQVERGKLLTVLQPRQIAATDAKRGREAFAGQAEIDDGCGQHTKYLSQTTNDGKQKVALWRYFSDGLFHRPENYW